MSVESRLDNIEEKVDKLMTNDIPHINERMGRIETNLSWLIKLPGLILATVVIGIVERFVMN